jgi:hypothetical protein
MRRSASLLVDEHLEHLLEEEGVALRARNEGLPHPLRHARLTEQHRDEPLGILRRQGRQRKSRRVLLSSPPGRAPGEKLGARGAHEEQARVSDGVHQVLDEIEQRDRGPVDVLDHDDGEPPPSERADVALPAVGEEGANAFGIRGREGRISFREADRPGDRVEDLACILLDDRLDGGSQLVERELDRIGVEDPRVAFRHLGQRPVGDSLAVGEAAPLEHARLREARDQLVDQPGLPHSGRAEERDELWHALAPAPRRHGVEQRQLLLPAHEGGGELGRTDGRLGLDRADVPCGDGGALPLRVELPPRPVEDRAARGGVRAPTDEDLALARVLLQAGGHVDGVTADDQLAAGGSLAA